ncbi:hypothetical protein U9M48_044431 [Paspalum notatum var. saurae]|uniref:Uncharacterized protein n=1 Tax=Paspalum notatum var. saurae TaxID=547442 RepID=A0AAQ3XGP9_PASNO
MPAPQGGGRSWGGWRGRGTSHAGHKGEAKVRAGERGPGSLAEGACDQSQRCNKVVLIISSSSSMS